MPPPSHPLAEVFGFPTNNFSDEAIRHRKNKLCRYNNVIPNCTKDKANDPLGVCSIFAEAEIAITCPIRFRQNWIIADHAAEFFFGGSTHWTSLTEVRLKDRQGKSAGNIDVVLVAYDGRGRITDFGALEVQAVYISGNVRNPFEYYMASPKSRATMDWRHRPNYPGPDYLSSSRKRLAPQLIFKGGILRTWGKKTAVALDQSFFSTLPTLNRVSKTQAEMAWLVYDLHRNEKDNEFVLKKTQTIYTSFDTALNQITRSEAGDMKDFIEILQQKLDEKLDGVSPDNQTIVELL